MNPQQSETGRRAASSNDSIPYNRQNVNSPASVQQRYPNTAARVESDGRAADTKDIDAEIKPYQKMEHHGNILDGLRSHLEEIKNMPAVKELTGNEFQADSGNNKNLRTRVLEFFNSIGNKVNRSGFGDIALNNAGVRDSLGHGYGKLKAATFAALPDVLSQGKIISYDPDFQGRKYESYLIAAPVKVGGDTCFVGAYIIKDVNTQRYKVHEVLTIDKNGTTPFKTGTLTQSDSRGAAPYNNTIPQNTANVNSPASVQQRYPNTAARAESAGKQQLRSVITRAWWTIDDLQSMGELTQWEAKKLEAAQPFLKNTHQKKRQQKNCLLRGCPIKNKTKNTNLTGSHRKSKSL